MDEVRLALVEAINGKNDDTRFNLKRLSIELGRNQAYLHQFLFAGKPRKLDEQDRSRLADLLDIDESTLMTQDQIRRIGKPGGTAVRRAPAFSYENKDLPIMGRAQAAHGDVFTLEGARVGVTERPSYLEGVEDAFAVYVAGDSMSPRFKPGEMVYVNPNRPPAAGDDVLVEMTDGTGIIKELTKITATTLTVKQHNPPQTKTFDLKKVKRISLIQGLRPRL
jgi:phage repressor protein C with HTH and peptisase S24 domain